MKPHYFLALTLAAATLFSGCGKSDNGAQKLKLAFVSNNAASFWTIARSGCLAAQNELGDVTVDFRIPSTGGAAEQQQILNDLVAAGVDGIAVSPINPANQTDFLNKIAGQTLLICADSDAADSKRVCYIGTDNEKAGEQAGGLIKEALPTGGKIIIFVGNKDAQNAKDRLGGITKILDGSNIQIIDVRTDDGDAVRAQKNAEDTLVKYPDIAALVGLYSYNGPAIANAVKGANKAGQVKIICFDSDDDTLAGISSGLIYATVVQQPYEFGRQAITRMDKYLHGDKTQLAMGKLIIPTISIKKDNVADFIAQQNKLLGK
jgi:ribose transport system substrate-binding protein